MSAFAKFKFILGSVGNISLVEKIILENKVDIIFHWIKAGLINITAPSILLDKGLRSLPHPSYYETGNILLWLKLIFGNSEYRSR